MAWSFKKILNKKTAGPIHWFSGINKENQPVYLDYIEMYKKAVISQKYTNPEMIAYLIFDGERDTQIDYLEDTLSVRIIPYKVSFYKELREFYGDNFIAGGAYLRCDIPIIVRDILNLDTEYVLYTDNDVLFLDDVSDLNYLNPNFFNISSEFSKKKYTDINSGVMWINIKNMYDIYPKFKEFIVKNFDKFETYDQDAIKLFFKKKWDILDYRYNYKPYFGKRHDIKILHFHGPKPQHVASCRENTHPLMSLVNDFYYEMVEYYDNLHWQVHKII